VENEATLKLQEEFVQPSFLLIVIDNILILLAKKKKLCCYKERSKEVTILSSL